MYMHIYIYIYIYQISFSPYVYIIYLYMHTHTHFHQHMLPSPLRTAGLSAKIASLPYHVVSHRVASYRIISKGNSRSHWRN